MTFTLEQGLLTVTDIVLSDEKQDVVVVDTAGESVRGGRGRARARAGAGAGPSR